MNCPIKFRQHIFLFLTIPALISCGDGGNITTPEVKPLTEAVYASGYVRAKNQYKVFAQTEGYLQEKLVEDGDIVKQNEPLFIIDSDQQSARHRIARENYELALRNYHEGSPVLQELESGAKMARSQMEFDSLHLARYENLWEANAVSKSAYDRAKLAYENSWQQYQLQKSRLQKMKDQLYVELQNARNQLEISGEESDQYIIRSQLDGRVFSTSKDEGELVRRGEVLAEIGQDSGFYLELSVDELDVSRVKKGQELLVKIDAFPDTIFNGVVTQVYPMINQQQQSIRVDAVLDRNLPGNFSGLALEANIIIRRKEEALVISRTALLPGDSVVISTEEGRKKVKVITGIETLDEVEIVEGIGPDTQLVGM